MEIAGPRAAGGRARIVVLSVVLLVAIFALLRRGGLPLWPPRDVLARTDARFAAAFVAAMVVHLVIRYLRTWFLVAPVRRVPLLRLFSINAIGMAFISALPFRLGEAFRPAMLREQGKLSAWAVAGTVFAERILDGSMYGGMLLVGLAVAHRNPPVSFQAAGVTISTALVPRVARVAGLFFTSAFAAMAGLHFFREAARPLVLRVLSPVSPTFASRVATVVLRVADGFGFLTNPRYSLPYLAVTLFAGACHVVAVGWLSRAVGLPPLGFAEGMVVVGILALGFVPLNAPGFFGAVQVALYAGLSVFASPSEVLSQGAAFVFVFYVTYLGAIAFLAAVGASLGLLRS
ncbi:MAG TPA: lysylphosphatidylglycerol synthase domain-containing protein [Polyangiaceae bacterium]|nr:lysylphosphatidylglycerol synthase domain-containing protein [Polyangiaceae bacterium]